MTLSCGWEQGHSYPHSIPYSVSLTSSSLRLQAARVSVNPSQMTSFGTPAALLALASRVVLAQPRSLPLIPVLPSTKVRQTLPAAPVPPAQQRIIPMFASLHCGDVGWTGDQPMPGVGDTATPPVSPLSSSFGGVGSQVTETPLPRNPCQEGPCRYGSPSPHHMVLTMKT